ncbi:hypothetical protein JXA85_02485 [Candidatus Woesearchaeota archaeon]|nr:hypothetical protein [Candidatus Woesearchaeota archaeon]
MATFENLIREINKTIFNFYIFNNILSALVVFLFTYLVLSLFTFHPVYAIIPAFIYFAVSTYVRMKESKVREVEEKFPHLDEKLRTAAQYSKVSNPVIDDLKREVLSQAGSIDSESFFHARRTALKVLVSVVLCFMIIFTSLLDYHFFDTKYYLQNQINKIPDFLKEKIKSLEKNDKDKGMFPGMFPEDEDGAGTLSNRDIYGDKKLAALGDEMVNMEMQSLNFRLSSTLEQDLQREQFEDSFPNEIYAEGAAAFKETISLKDQEVVRRYFNSLARG